jgi:hypothetical protein
MYLVEEIKFATRNHAQSVLDHVKDCIHDYGIASVSDYYDLAGKSSYFPDSKYGWGDISSASIGYSRDGFIIRMPEPQDMDTITVKPLEEPINIDCVIPFKVSMDISSNGDLPVMITYMAVSGGIQILKSFVGSEAIELYRKLTGL